MLTSDPNSFLNSSLICFLIASTSIPFAFFLSWFFNEQHCSTSLKIKSNSTSELNWAIFYCFWKQPAGCKVLCHSDWNCFLVLRDFRMKFFALALAFKLPACLMKWVWIFIMLNIDKFKSYSITNCRHIHTGVYTTTPVFCLWFRETFSYFSAW